jgi:hypothetical protein
MIIIIIIIILNVKQPMFWVIRNNELNKNEKTSLSNTDSGSKNGVSYMVIW